MRPPEETLVLVVDDHALNLELLRQDLGEAGYRVSTARSGPEALAQIEREPPHIVLLDIMMPVLSGLEVLRRLRATPATADLPDPCHGKSQSRDVVRACARSERYVQSRSTATCSARMEALAIKTLQEEVEARNERIRRT
jgi:PleD family two-component response regulator